MNDNKFDKDKLLNLWLDDSEDDFETMIALLDSKRYSWSFFIGH